MPRTIRTWLADVPAFPRRVAQLRAAALLSRRWVPSTANDPGGRHALRARHAVRGQRGVQLGAAALLEAGLQDRDATGVEKMKAEAAEAGSRRGRAGGGQEGAAA
ncbi:MAG: hypothetical protein U0797_26350 [Gemmataceae bacterium]